MYQGNQGLSANRRAQHPGESAWSYSAFPSTAYGPLARHLYDVPLYEELDTTNTPAPCSDSRDARRANHNNGLGRRRASNVSVPGLHQGAIPPSTRPG